MDGFAQAQKGKMMSDLISRQRLLEYIHGEPVGRLLCDKYNLDGLIKQFPSAQPYTDEEIQKMQDIEQAQLDKIRELAYQEGKADAMAEIIRCRDCKLRDTEYCNMAHGFMGMKDDDYCSYAERRWRRTND